MRSSRWKPNYGDMLVCSSIIRQLEIGEVVHVAFGETLQQPIDRAIIRGSTYLHSEFAFDAANKTLDSINSPIAIVGLGAQNPTRDIKYLDGNAEARNFIARLNEKSKSISVRGEFTASVVDRLGGKNIIVTGCPSMFYNLLAPTISVPELLLRPERSVGVSIHTGLTKNIFCRAPESALAMHGQAVSWAIANAVNVSIFEQGVIEEFNVSADDLSYEERHRAALVIVERMQAKALLSAESLIAYMVSVKSIEEWLSRAFSLDAIIGFRFHGNMISLLQGKPTFYYTYDSRLEEFCDIYYLPSQDVTEPWRNPIVEMVNHDWMRTNKRVKDLFENIKLFYRQNGFQMKTASLFM